MHRRNLSSIKGITAGLVAAVLLISLATTAVAQVIILPPPPPGVGIDPPGYYFWANPTTRAGMGANNATAGTMGSWFFGTTNGNPFTPYDDDCRLVLKTEAYLYIADDDSEVKIGDKTNTTDFPAVKPDLRSAGFVWNNVDDQYPISVDFRMRLVRDVVKWEYTIKNLSPYARRLGFRVLENISWPPNEPLRTVAGVSGMTPVKAMLESPYRFPGGTSTNVTSEYVGSAVPDKWYIEYPENPGIDDGYRAWWKGSQPLRDTASRPSRLVFGNWTALTTYTWSDIQDALLPENAGQPWPLLLGDALADDTGVGLYYPILTLAPNATRKITGEVQFNWAQFNTVGHYSLSAYGPDWLGFRDGDDPTTLPVENGYYAPNYAEISAWVTNNSLIDEPNVSVSIDPGEGLALADGQTLSYNNMTLRGMQERLVKKAEDDEYSWRLVPTGTAYGRIPVRITATYSLTGSTSTVVYVNVPALPKRTLQPATHLIGFPFQLDADPNDGVNTADARTALGLGPNVQLVSYDPVTSSYKYAASDGVTLEPGRAYWLKVNNTTPLSLTNATAVSQREAYRVQLYKGWNAISTPFQFTTEWGKCRVIWNSEEYPFADALARGLIRPELWAWDPLKNVYTPPVNPAPLNATTTELKPYQGFWLYASESCRLVYSPDTTLAVMNPNTTGARSANRTAGTAERWQANLLVQAGEAKDTLNVFGVAPASTEAGTDGNLMEPPISPIGLSAYFARRDGTRAAGNYAQYLQAPGGAKTWTFEVQCTRAETLVALRWPDLSNLPAGLPVVLTDETTGQQVSLRTSTGYSYNSGQGGVRRFTLQAGGQLERLRFSQVQVVAGKASAPGAAVRYALSLPAAVTLEWRTPTGRLVRTLSPGRSSGELTTSIWDGCDAQGRRLPGGLYLCTLTAEAADGQRTRTSLTVPVK